MCSAKRCKKKKKKKDKVISPRVARPQIFERFLLGTGRMPHPVGGAMGVTLYTAAPRVKPALTSFIRQLCAGSRLAVVL